MLKELKIFICLCLLVQLVHSNHENQRILLSDVKVLTLYKDRQTQGRRGSSIPQLSCIGGSAKCSYVPDKVECYNQGSDGIDIQWKCNCELPRTYKLGELNVICEGYDSPDDPFILVGSCGLDFRLEYADWVFDYLKFYSILMLFIFLLGALLLYIASGSNSVNASTVVRRPERRESLNPNQYESDHYISEIRRTQQDAESMCKKRILHTHPDPERPVHRFCQYPGQHYICDHSKSSDNTYDSSSRSSSPKDKYDPSFRPSSSKDTYDPSPRSSASKDTHDPSPRSSSSKNRNHSSSRSSSSKDTKDTHDPSSRSSSSKNRNNSSSRSSSSKNRNNSSSRSSSSKNTNNSSSRSSSSKDTKDTHDPSPRSSSSKDTHDPSSRSSSSKDTHDPSSRSSSSKDTKDTYDSSPRSSSSKDIKDTYDPSSRSSSSKDTHDPPPRPSSSKDIKDTYDPSSGSSPSKDTNNSSSRSNASKSTYASTGYGGTKRR